MHLHHLQGVLTLYFAKANRKHQYRVYTHKTDHTVYAATKQKTSTYLISCSNLMHHLFITFITFLYMFRVTLCSSSGGFTVHIQLLVLCMSLFFGDRSVHRQFLCTERSPKKSYIQRTRCCMYTVNPPDDEHKVARNM